VLAAGCAAQDAPIARLEGTSWQLAKIQGGDGTTRVPGEKSKYTFTFGADGVFTARIDCNRARGAWRSSRPGRIEIGPQLAITRAECPPGSLHDRVVKDLSFVRSYLVRSGHLFLSLMADAAVYELEPL